MEDSPAQLAPTSVRFLVQLFTLFFLNDPFTLLVLVFFLVPAPACFSFTIVARGPWDFVPGCVFGSCDCVQVVGNFENSFLECCFDLKNDFLLSPQSVQIYN